MAKTTKPQAYYMSSAAFTQEGDSCNANKDQSLEIESQDAGAGAYFVIKTERWAFDSIEELTSTLKRFIDAHIAGEPTPNNRHPKQSNIQSRIRKRPTMGIPQKKTK